MALNLKTKNITTEKITIKTIYVNTSEASCVQWEGKLQPYYEQLDNTASEIRYQKANEYSQMKDRQDPTYHMYENNDQTLQDVIQEMKQINHLESKLPIVLSSKKDANRHFKIGIGLLATICCILVVALISVAVTPSTKTPCVGNPCQNSGKFTYSINSSQPSCECKDGYSGNNCQVTPCTEINCDNSGTCLIIGNTSVCECPDGISGELCQNYICNAEYNNGFNCILEQDRLSDDVDWVRKAGSTPTSFTGPSQAAEGNYYLYFKGSYPAGSIARLTSRTMKTGYTKCLSFNYHMYGRTMGALHVYGDMKHYWGRSGNHFNNWYFTTVTISSAVSKITFHARRGLGVYSDIAIDNITITPNAC